MQICACCSRFTTEMPATKSAFLFSHFSLLYNLWKVIEEANMQCWIICASALRKIHRIMWSLHQERGASAPRQCYHGLSENYPKCVSRSYCALRRPSGTAYFTQLPYMRIRFPSTTAINFTCGGEAGGKSSENREVWVGSLRPSRAFETTVPQMRFEDDLFLYQAATLRIREGEISYLR